MAKNIERRVEELEKASWLKRGNGLTIVQFVEASDKRPLPPGELLGYQIYGGAYVERKPKELEGSVYERASKAALAGVNGNNNFAVLLEDRAPHGAPTKHTLSPAEAYLEMLNG